MMVTYSCSSIQFSSVQLFIIGNDNYSQMVNAFREISQFPDFNSIETGLTRFIDSSNKKTVSKIGSFRINFVLKMERKRCLANLNE